MRCTLKRIGATLGRFHRDQDGAEMLEVVLIVAAIALPLLGLLIWFWKDLWQWLTGKWEDVKDEADTAP